MSELVPTSIGVLPQDWEIRRLAETTTKIQDGTHFSPQSQDGPRLYVTSKNIKFGRLDLTDCEHISQKEHDAIYARCDVKLGDVLLTKDGANTGNACLNTLSEPFSLLSSVAFLRTDESANHAGFILQYLLSPFGQRRLKDLMSGNAIPRLTLEKIKAFRTPAPPLPTQQKIARILQTVDRAMEKTEALIEKYQQIKAGLMHDLFTRGLWTQEELKRGDHLRAAKEAGLPAIASATAGQLRPTRQDAPHLYQETPIGWIPKAWGATQFGTVAASSVLGSPRRGVLDRADLVPLLKMGNLEWGGLDLQEVEMVSRRRVPDYQSLLLKDGDLLFNTRNTPELVGKTAAWRGEIPGAICDNNILRVRFHDGMNGVFLASWMSNGTGRRKIGQLVTGTTSVAAIYWRSLKKLPVPVPSRTEQDQSVQRLDLADGKIRTLQSQLAKFQKQKSGLMHDLLTGRVPVTPDSSD